MKKIKHYLKPVLNGSVYRAPWAPRAVKELELPPLPPSLATHYAHYHHSFRFRIGSLTFLSAEEVKSIQGHTLFARILTKSVFYDPATDTVYASARPQRLHDAISFDAFLLDNRPCWADY